MVVPSPPFGPPEPRPEMEPLSKESLRRAALDARKAFVRTLSDADREQLQQKLAQNLTSLFAGVSVVGGYHPLGSEISPLPAMEEARAVGAIVAFPCFTNPEVRGALLTAAHPKSSRRRERTAAMSSTPCARW